MLQLKMSQRKRFHSSVNNMTEQEKKEAVKYDVEKLKEGIEKLDQNIKSLEEGIEREREQMKHYQEIIMYLELNGSQN